MTHESPVTLKKNLLSIISDMQSASHLFVKQPGKDFSRKRKVSFSDTIRFLFTTVIRTALISISFLGLVI